MSYIKDTLLKDEQVSYSTKPHYIMFYPVLLWLALALFMAVIVYSTMLANIMLIVGLVSFVNSLINYTCSEYVITNKRILMKVGFIRRQSLELFLERIEGVCIEQDIIGRILNYGTVIISGVGGTKTPFFFIRKPLEFRAVVQGLISQSVSK